MNVMIWSRMTLYYLWRQYFFDECINSDSHFQMLESLLIPQLQEKDTMEHIWIQQVGATTHSFSGILFPKWTISRPLDRLWFRSPASLQWPPWSPDLTKPGNSLWGIIKAYVFQHWYNKWRIMKRVEEVFLTITSEMLHNMTKRTWVHKVYVHLAWWWI